MPGELYGFLSADHERLDVLLQSALRDDGRIDEASYEAFRRGLLRHIAIEEKVLFVEIRRRGDESAVVEQLHRDHAALAALLIPPPTAVEIETMMTILHEHNPLEEGPGGLYDRVEKLAQTDLENLVERARAIPEVRLAPHVDTPVVRRSIEQLLREAAEGRLALRNG